MGNTIELRVVDQLLNGQKQSVAISQTNKVVSNAFQITADDSVAFGFQIAATVSSGTAAIVKLQHSIDGVLWADVDATNAKVTLASTGSYPLMLNVNNSTIAAKMPLYRWGRFVCTTTSADAVIITACLVQVHF